KGNLIGTDVSGNIALGNAWSGIWISGGADSNVIGGAGGERNVIAANGKRGDSVNGTGIAIDTPGNSQAHGNLIYNNYLGIKANGRQPLGNEADGVLLYGTGNSVGGADNGQGNVISGNGDTGVRLSAGSNSVLGNFIGTTGDGTLAAGNNTAGVAVTS